MWKVCLNSKQHFSVQKQKIFVKKIAVNIVTLGCSKNKVDSEHLAALLPYSKYNVKHDSDAESDVVIVNTCGFIADAQEESIDSILAFSELRKTGKLKKLYVMGCLSQRYKEILQKEIPEVDAYFGVNDLTRIASEITEMELEDVYSCKRILSTPNHYAYLKISEGCNRQCSFCAIPLIRGKHISVPKEKLIEEAASLAKKGVKELIVIAQDITCYGIDLYGKSKITELVRDLTKIDGIEWIRLHYGYPLGFPDDLLNLMNENPKICRYIDLPLQHIDTSILKSMKRGITREETIQFVKNVRKKVPGIAFRTTFIVGYPNETEEMFEDLCEFVREMEFERVGVFSYSPEEGTPAFELEDNVPFELKQERVSKLMEIQQNISLINNCSKIGKTEKVLIDRMESGYYVGRTQFDSPEVDDEILILDDGKADKIGQFAEVKIIRADYFDCEAEFV